ncbi:nicotinate-nucleotide pyrophosphorylase (carboxylating) [Isosphaera pallida ATCC 43644]|uniref:Probable nicotinate-nucleotide pyrophosphorylase [carboxylating] n=1 Tax=Isosphaera pallida (strain ATCC 43644 / DSM 9630 / IS1B) TaxID=575540 RepID=E8R0Z9_ISOPI|nr:carboxylating nicotinate-nucleotide diphosphorylase [Isosphaera pallida]ADV63350.1 nicotinate-nucleotide pyrophosphorylase (carboxylating) [Isosphaera pallida ATCC 43644]
MIFPHPTPPCSLASSDWSLPGDGFGPSERENALRIIQAALSEDLGNLGDVTSQALLEASAQAEAWVVTRAAGVVAGLPLVPLLIQVGGFQLDAVAYVRDGQSLESGTPLLYLRGSARDLLAVERTLLNMLQRLSGIASQTALFVERTRGTRAVVLDTRKTTPGLRLLEKYAVRCGGGRNHRIGLYDQILIKDNHLAFLERQGVANPIAHAVLAGRRRFPQLKVEVEVDRLDQFQIALEAGPDLILVDNFALDQLRTAVALRDRVAPTILIEVSGGVTLDRVGELAATGVDRISVGALTHSAPALDLGMDDRPPA